MRKLVAALVSSLLFVSAGCGVEAGTGEEGLSSGAIQGVDDEGTELSATVAAGAVACQPDGSGIVPLAGTVETNGSVDSVEIQVSVDGQPRVLAGTIEPQDFSHAGRIKTAPYSVSLTLASGSHGVEVCFVQSGAHGRTPKETCLAAVTVVVACEQDGTASCGDAEFFGDVVKSPSLCRGNGPPHIPVHVRGELGEAPTLVISGPGGFVLSVAMRRAGDSCNYHYNWNTRGNPGAGDYTFTVSGNGQTVSTTEALLCR